MRQLKSIRDDALVLASKYEEMAEQVRVRAEVLEREHGLSSHQDGDLNRELWRLIGFMEGLDEAAQKAVQYGQHRL